MKFAVESTIACPPEQAFDLMADARNETRWNSQVSRAELETAEPIGHGSRFAVVNRGQDYAATIATYERPGLLVFDVEGRPMAITARFSFHPDGDGTAARAEFDMRPKGPMKLVFPLLRPVVRRDLRKQTQSFASLCESG